MVKIGARSFVVTASIYRLVEELLREVQNGPKRNVTLTGAGYPGPADSKPGSRHNDHKVLERSSASRRNPARPGGAAKFDIDGGCA